MSDYRVFTKQDLLTRRLLLLTAIAVLEYANYAVVTSFDFAVIPLIFGVSGTQAICAYMLEQIIQYRCLDNQRLILISNSVSQLPHVMSVFGEAINKGLQLRVRDYYYFSSEMKIKQRADALRLISNAVKR